MKTQIPPRLRWACRRGMLELDILLGNFLEQAYLVLPLDEQAIFLKVLQCEDQDLFEWLTVKKIPQDPEIKSMIEKIRLHAKQPH
jgi:antitoxin CptB